MDICSSEVESMVYLLGDWSEGHYISGESYRLFIMRPDIVERMQRFNRFAEDFSGRGCMMMWWIIVKHLKNVRDERILGRKNRFTQHGASLCFRRLVLM